MEVKRYKMIRKRRREARTDYNKRIALLKGGIPRVVIRKSNRCIVAQIVSFTPTGDKVLTGAHSRELIKYEWQPRSNIPTAYLTGMLLAKKAKQLKLDRLVLDMGLYKPVKSNVIFAAAKGAADNGLKLSHGIEFDEKRLSGAHIAEYANMLKKDQAMFSRQFSGYEKSKFDASKINENFEKAKAKLKE
ncbi:MAG: 50S ribosomal protein L18 [Candidatus Marsarchaeota archaeon]|nr:50S ribosomal protein L18 [Candidatus Marsarchaeota archaeon]